MSVFMLETDHVAIRPTAFMSLALVIAGTAACAELDPATDDCRSIGNGQDPACQAAVAAGSGNVPAGPPIWEQERFACLAPNYTPPPVMPTAQAVNLSAIVVDYANLTPLPELTMSFCLTMDSACDAPTVPKAVSVPGMEPLVNVTIRTGLEGYLRQDAPGHVRQDYYLLAPMLIDDASLVGPTDVFTLVAESSITGFIDDLGINVNRDLGIMAFYVVDCDGERVEGARLNLPELSTRTELRNVRAWSINGSFPVPDVPTDGDGVSGFANVPEGTVVVEAVVDGYTFGQTRIRVLGNRLTGATIRPWYLTGR